MTQRIPSVPVSGRLRSVGLSVLVHSLGFLVALFTAWTTIGLTTNGQTSEAGLLDYVLEGIAFAAVISVFQWIVLRSKALRLVRFVYFSSVGLAIGWPLGEVLSSSAGWIVSAAIFGLFLGLFQWLVIRGQYVLAKRWVPVTMAAWILAAIPAVYIDNFIVLIIGTPLIFGLVLGPFAANLVTKRSTPHAG